MDSNFAAKPRGQMRSKIEDRFIERITLEIRGDALELNAFDVKNGDRCMFKNRFEFVQRSLTHNSNSFRTTGPAGQSIPRTRNRIRRPDIGSRIPRARILAMGGKNAREGRRIAACGLQTSDYELGWADEERPGHTRNGADKRSLVRATLPVHQLSLAARGRLLLQFNEEAKAL